jgi:DNA-binding Lrp family transcriptional regulator
MNENSINLDTSTSSYCSNCSGCQPEQPGPGPAAELSAPTCLRRVKRLQELGLIEKQVAILSSEHIARAHRPWAAGHCGSLAGPAGQHSLLQFEHKAVAEPGVQQCWRVSPGPDFVLVMASTDMPAYLALSQKLFTQDANVRNVKPSSASSAPNSVPNCLCLPNH